MSSSSGELLLTKRPDSVISSPSTPSSDILATAYALPPTATASPSRSPIALAAAADARRCSM
jgi:hypothetical protein